MDKRGCNILQRLSFSDYQLLFMIFGDINIDDQVLFRLQRIWLESVTLLLMGIFGFCLRFLIVFALLKFGWIPWRNQQLVFFLIPLNINMNIFGKLLIFLFLQLLHNLLIIWQPLGIDNFSDFSLDSPLNHSADCDVLSFYPTFLFVFTFTFVDIRFKCQLLFIFFILNLIYASVFSFIDSLFADLVQGL